MAPANSPAGEVTAVVSVGGQFVMAGSDSTATGTIRGDQAGIWRSRDGKTWDPVGGAGVAVHGTAIEHLATSGTTVVTTGSDVSSGRSVAAVWRSSDAGATWARVTADPTVFGTQSTVDQIVGTPDGFIAVGRIIGRPEGQNVMWLSRDGTAWSLATGVDTTAGLPSVLVPNGHGLVAFYAFSGALLPPGNTYVSVAGKLPK